MKPYCEVVVSYILPAIRALITRELLTAYNLTQMEASELLGITQAAISQYNKESRGTKVNILEKDKKIMKMIKQLAKKIARGNMTALKINSEFCKICKEIRKRKLICQLHKDIYPSLESCSECY
ncbi:MAG: transcriptional regulator [Candidatus Aenigmarchaeota archaeon ex4484_56]|nr:MAG: transcriptional regulator [Candidatus Aenigmarchaeota archaeon ex4484_56]